MSCRTAKPQLHTNADIVLFEIGKCNKRKQPAAAAAAAASKRQQQSIWSSLIRVQKSQKGAR
jgi:hypothetical protein